MGVVATEGGGSRDRATRKGVERHEIWLLGMNRMVILLTSDHSKIVRYDYYNLTARECCVTEQGNMAKYVGPRKRHGWLEVE